MGREAPLRLEERLQATDHLAHGRSERGDLLVARSIGLETNVELAGGDATRGGREIFDPARRAASEPPTDHEAARDGDDEHPPAHREELLGVGVHVTARCCEQEVLLLRRALHVDDHAAQRRVAELEVEAIGVARAPLDVDPELGQRRRVRERGRVRDERAVGTVERAVSDELLERIGLVLVLLSFVLSFVFRLERLSTDERDCVALLLCPGLEPAIELVLLDALERRERCEPGGDEERARAEREVDREAMPKLHELPKATIR